MDLNFQIMFFHHEFEICQNFKEKSIRKNPEKKQQPNISFLIRMMDE